MPYTPPKGIAPPQLAGKRTGRPRGSRNLARAWRDVLWAYKHAGDDETAAPTGHAALWRSFAEDYPDAVSDFLDRFGMLGECGYLA
jgi:hypothetical protein